MARLIALLLIVAVVEILTFKLGAESARIECELRHRVPTAGHRRQPPALMPALALQRERDAR